MIVKFLTWPQNDVIIIWKTVVKNLSKDKYYNMVEAAPHRTVSLFFVSVAFLLLEVVFIFQEGKQKENKWILINKNISN